MKTKKLILSIFFVLLSTLLIAATQSDVIPVTIENASNDYVTLLLTGPRYYYLSVKPGETKTFTVVRDDDYKQEFYSCGAYVNPNLDLTKKVSIVVPKCGLNAYKYQQGSLQKSEKSKIDGGQIIKLVKVHFKNTSGVKLVIILDEIYVFTLEKGKTHTYTIAKGNYTIEVLGCGVEYWVNFSALEGKTKEISCPNW